MPLARQLQMSCPGAGMDLRHVEHSVRADMYEVIIERPRGGAGWGRDWPRFDWRQAAIYAQLCEPEPALLPAPRRLDEEDAELADGRGLAGSEPRQPRLHGFCDGGPTKLRMGPRSRSKWLSENLAPLRRFLLRRLGRPWNDVHSEICAHIGLRSAVQKHVLDHLRHYVELQPILIDGYPHYPTLRGGRQAGPQPLSDYGHAFYVCPQRGTLELAGHPRRRPRQSSPSPNGAPTAPK